MSINNQSKTFVRIITAHNLVKDFDVSIAPIGREFVARCGSYAGRGSNRIDAIKQCGQKIASGEHLPVKDAKKDIKPMERK